MSDIMRRFALQEPMTPDEHQQADYCTENIGLYPIINAAFALAAREGLTMNLDLKRPQPKRPRRRKP